MTRKTKAQLKLEEDQAQEELWNEFVRLYSSRFAKVLFSYCQRYSDGFSVSYNRDVDSYKFSCDDDNSGTWLDYWLPVTLNDILFADQNEIMYYLDSVENGLAAVDAYKKSQQEKTLKRQMALNKLTNEEKELLGL